jgi:hypothetical protein
MPRDRLVKNMTDEQLATERKYLSNCVGKYAADRWSRILAEQIRREEENDNEK